MEGAEPAAGVLSLLARTGPYGRRCSLADHDGGWFGTLHALPNIEAAYHFCGVPLDLFKWFRRNPKRKSSDWSAPLAEMYLRGGGTARVTVETALQIAAVYSCVRIISESLASVPLVLYRRNADGRSKTRAESDSLYELMRWRPNPFETSLEWRELALAEVILAGNHFSHITRMPKSGDVVEVMPLERAFMRVERGKFGPKFIYEPNGEPRRVFEKKSPTDAPEVLHLRGLRMGKDLLGRSVLEDAAETFGLAAAGQEYGRRVFDNDATPGLVIEMGGDFPADDEEAIKKFREAWHEAYAGPRNAGKVAILTNGAKASKLSFTAQEVQFLETRKFSRSEIASLFRVPPHMIGDLDRATFSNIEQQSIEFVVHTLRPWAVRFEQALHSALLSDSSQQKRGYFFEFLLEGLMRGDLKSRYEAYKVGREGGWLSANDILALENSNPIEGGDRYLEPMNYRPVSGSGAAGTGDSTGAAA